MSAVLESAPTLEAAEALSLFASASCNLTDRVGVIAVRVAVGQPGIQVDQRKVAGWVRSVVRYEDVLLSMPDGVFVALDDVTAIDDAVRVADRVRWAVADGAEGRLELPVVTAGAAVAAQAESVLQVLCRAGRALRQALDGNDGRTIARAVKRPPAPRKRWA